MSQASIPNQAPPDDPSDRSPIEFQPFVSPQTQAREFTMKAVASGILLGLIFGASSVYLALRAGMTLGGSISIAVVAIAFLKRFGKTTILENNLIQTIGSTGESVAAGMVFRTTGFLFLAGGAQYFHYWQLITIAILGGLLGILFMIPLRHILIVKEHGKLMYPEGSACAEILMAGEKQGESRKPVFLGVFIATVYWFAMKLFGLWKDLPYLVQRCAKTIYPNASLSVSVAPEYLGIGYLIGPRAATQMMLGGLLVWMVLIPVFSKWPSLAHLLGAKDVYATLQDLGVAIPTPQAMPTAAQVNEAYGKFIAVGVMVYAGFITLIKAFPIMKASVKNAIERLRTPRLRFRLRTDIDLPLWVVILGVAAILGSLVLLPQIPGEFPVSLLAAGMIVFFGLFFVLVSSRIVGVIGYSMDPVGSMMFSTVLVTCLIFVFLRRFMPVDQTTALLIGAVVCTAAGNAGATSQDLKTGFLLGATPWKQQVGLILGVILSALVMGGIVLLVDHSIPTVSHAIGYIVPGEETARYAAPPANLISVLIKAVFSGKTPWGLVLFGMGLAVLAELSGVVALSFAAGVYLPLSVTSAIFLGAMVRLLVNRKERRSFRAGSDSQLSPEMRPGMLLAAGLVAGGSLAGMLLGFWGGFFPDQAYWFDLGHQYWDRIKWLGNGIALGVFFLLGALFYFQAQKKKDEPGPVAKVEGACHTGRRIS